MADPEKKHLSVVQYPRRPGVTVRYREPPTDVEYRHREEMANCDWCRWKDGGYCGHPAQRVSPSGWVPGVTIIWNPKGDCQRYEASGFTRLARKLGLRRPIWK